MPTHSPLGHVRRSAVLALLLVVVEAAVAALFALVPAAPLLSPLSPWALVALPAVALTCALALLVVALDRRSRALVGGSALAVAVALGALIGLLGVALPSLRGAGLAFAAPLLVGEIVAAGAWLAFAPEGAQPAPQPGAQWGARVERVAAALALLAAALTTCTAAFVSERLDVDVAPLAIGVFGVCAQLQLAMARVGEAAHPGLPLQGSAPGFGIVGARFGAVPRALVLAALGRSGPQGDA